MQKATEAPKMVEDQSIKRNKPSEQPGGSVETVGSLTARVDEIDYIPSKQISPSMARAGGGEPTAIAYFGIAA